MSIIEELMKLKEKYEQAAKQHEADVYANQGAAQGVQASIDAIAKSQAKMATVAKEDIVYKIVEDNVQ